MDSGLTIFLLILFGYIGVLLYFNSRVRLNAEKRQELQIKNKRLRSVVSVSGAGVSFLVALLLALLAYAIIKFSLFSE